RALAVAFPGALRRRPGGGEALSTSEGSVGVFAVARRDHLAAGGWPVAKVVHAGPPDHPDLADAAGDHAVAELQAKAASRDDVVLDDAAAPRASRDGQPDGRDSLAVGSSAPDAVGRVAEAADAVDRVLRLLHDAVSRTKLGVLYRAGHSALLEDRVDGSGADDHGSLAFRPPFLTQPGKIVAASFCPCASA